MLDENDVTNIIIEAESCWHRNEIEFEQLKTVRSEARCFEIVTMIRGEITRNYSVRICVETGSRTDAYLRLSV